MDRLLDPKNDWAFKQVFAGEEKHKDILLKFLNDVLNEHVLHGNLITDIRFLKVNLDTEIIALRQSIVDVLCKAHILSLKCRERQIPASFSAQLSTQVVCT